MTAPVWVLAEMAADKAASVSLELTGKARQLADFLGEQVAAIVMGQGADRAAGELVAAGADTVLLIEHPHLAPHHSGACARVLAEMVREHMPQIVLAGATPLGADIAARLAARLETGLTAHCLDLSVEEIDDAPQLVQVVPGWGGNLALRILCPERRPQMATVRPGVFDRPQPDQARRSEVIHLYPEVTPQELIPRDIEVVHQTSGEMPLEEATTVVAGGWGLCCAEQTGSAKELCSVLGACLAGTRPAVDKGMVNSDRMIGHSGKSVSPRLLVTLGASGAIHFTSGFLRSTVVLAVDRNPQAPIFEACDVGIVGDLKEVLPLLCRELAAALNR
ncbi:MAG: electron transfer flavoprotein subunit alpha/FixB family protein [Dehalococcoidia bacterium]|jgi:electron transfer flavoprotein alpha subunit|nr:electron transfer flavoprotein subunit alpha/FixB family protein [Dehalococcoidia bacterium]